MSPSDIQNSLNWDLALRKTYQSRAPVAEGELQPYKPPPILPITISVDSYVLAIGGKSSTAKSHWKLAAWVAPRLLFSPSSTSEFIAAVQSEKPQKVFLERLNLIQFVDFGIKPYLLEIIIPRWHTEMYLEVWKYSGAQVTTDLLNSLNLARQKLEIIEEKVDFINTYGNQ